MATHQGHQRPSNLKDRLSQLREMSKQPPPELPLSSDPEPSADILIEFTRTKLSTSQFLQSSVLSHTQKELLRNDISETAQQLLSLTFDPTQPHKFVQDHAFLKGQLELLQYLISRSDESEQTLRQLANQSDQ